MSYRGSFEIQRAFFPQNSQSFAELIAKIQATQTLSPTQARDMTSGLRRVAKALGRRVEETPAVPRWLQPRISMVSPPAVGMTVKSWQNAVSSVKAAMAFAGIVKRSHRSKSELMPEWKALWTIALALERPILQPAIGRFVYFLSSLGVRPTEETETHAKAYLHGLELNEISKDPDRAYRAAVNGWNLANRHIPEWPKITLALPSRARLVRPTDDIFTRNFWQN